MKFLTLTILTLISTTTLVANALELECQAKYFNGEKSAIHLEAKSPGEMRLTQVKLTLDGERFRQAKSVSGREYNGRKYSEMIRFGLKSTEGDVFEEASVSILLPQGWGEAGEFIGYVVEKASDGGSYNKIFCSTID